MLEPPSASSVASRDLAARVVATAGMMLATTMNALDSTIANVALPHIQGSLSAGQDQITWVLTSYIVATAIMTPFSGWLSLKIGRKPLFLASIAAFVVASVLCGAASNLPEMVLVRLLQGFAGAAMAPISQAAVLDLWPPGAITRVMSIWSSVMMVGPILGPTLGGFLTEHYSWRWVFYINVPIGLLAFAAVYVALEADRGGRERPFDSLGFWSLVLFTGAVQLLADRGPGQDWLGSPEICAYAVLAACSVHVFLMQSLTAREPFFHRGVLADRNFLICCVFSFFMSAMLFATSALLPSFMQNLLGYSALQSGLATMYRGVGSLAAFAIGPWLQRRLGDRRTISLGILIAICSLWKMAQFDLSMARAPIIVAGLLQGVGIGLMFNPLAVLGFATLPEEHRTEAAVLGNVTRTLGSSLGIAVMQAILVRESAAAHEQLASRIDASDPVIRWALPHIFDGPQSALAALNAEITRQGAMMAYDTVFAWMAVLAGALWPMVLLIRPTGSRPKVRPPTRGSAIRDPSAAATPAAPAVRRPVQAGHDRELASQSGAHR